MQINDSKTASKKPLIIILLISWLLLSLIRSCFNALIQPNRPNFSAWSMRSYKWFVQLYIITPVDRLRRPIQWKEFSPSGHFRLGLPSKDNLCTRFATKVILRRASTKGLSVSIMPGQDRSAVDRERLLDFRYTIRIDENFATLFEKAKQVMGLTDHSSAFSKDILRVEIFGPN